MSPWRKKSAVRVAAWIPGWVLAVVLLAGIAVAGESTAVEENAVPGRLRILCYNVRNTAGMDEVVDPDRTARVIREATPDVASLQELDRRTRRSGGTDRIVELAERTGLVATFGPAIDFQGGKYGVGILSKRKPILTRTVPLPGREERRVLLIAEFPGYVFFSTHFSLTAEDRLESARIINQECEKYHGIPIFLAGDFNCAPDDEPMVELGKVWKRLSPDAPTYPADQPDLPIDHILAAGLPESARTTESRVVDAPVESDHRPVFVEVTLSPIESTTDVL